MTLTSDISQAVPTILKVLPMTGPTYQTKLVAAIQCLSVVDTVAQAFEILYTAIHEDATLDSNSQNLQAVAAATKQLGYYLTYYGWHGKLQRAADVGVVCDQLLAGTALSAITNLPAVDPEYTTIVVPLQQAQALN